jgi:glutamate 5-kinase
MRDAKRVVVKVGTAVVTRPDARLALGRLGALVEQIRRQHEAGREVVLVSSGAIGLGADRLGLDKPTTIVDRQACAAAGQSSLMAFYDGLFRRLGSATAQLLLTEEDFASRHRHVHLSATLERLLQLGVVPVVNENDTVSTAEIALRGSKVFGDNDQLSALVASSMGADVLLLLSDVPGVYTGPPSDPGSERIGVWTADTEVRFGSGSARGRGGMQAKIEAALVGARAGVTVVIADGRDPEVIGRVLDGEDVGTVFPGETGLSRRRQWLAFATAPVGTLRVNEGAKRALVERQASLLSVGITEVVGHFAAGDIVSICDPEGVEIARGRCDRSAAELGALVGQPGDGKGRAVVHRDHVVILERS